MKGLQTRDRELRNWLIAQDPSLTPTIGSLRQEVTFKNNLSTMMVDFLENLSRLKSLTERLLNTNDGFVAHSIAVCVMRVVKGQEGASLPASYVNPAVFPESAGFKPEHLDGVLYNGKMEIRNNNVILAKEIDLLRFKRVPRTQKSKNFNILGATTGQVEQAILGLQDEFDLDKIITDIEPYFLMSGGKKPLITVQLPLFDSVKLASVETDVDYKLCIIANGMYLESGAKAIEAIAGRLGQIRKARVAQRQA